WFEFDPRCDVFTVITGVGYGCGGAKTDIGYLCRSGVNLSRFCLWIEIDCNEFSFFSDDDHIILFNIEKPDITSNLCSFGFLRNLLCRWGFDLGLCRWRRRCGLRCRVILCRACRQRKQHQPENNPSYRNKAFHCCLLLVSTEVLVLVSL